MKKSDIKTRRILRRALALVLAVVLVSGLGLSYSSDRVLKAEEITSEEVKEDKADDSSQDSSGAQSGSADISIDSSDNSSAQGGSASDADTSGSSAGGTGSGSSAVSETGTTGSGSDAASETGTTEDEIILDARESGETGAADNTEESTDTAASDQTDGKEDEAEKEDEVWIVTFYNRDAEVYKKVEVKKGEAIGSDIPSAIPREDYYAYWAVGEIVQGGQGSEIKVTGERISGNFKPSGDTVIVPDYDEIKHSVTFYDSEGGSVIEGGVRSVGPDTNYCLNDIPAVPEKEGSKGKWVYAGGDFSNRVAISEDTAVWAVYDQTVFTVTFTAEGKTYEKDRYYKGDSLKLPEEPVTEGKTFEGWYSGDTQYTGGEEVTSDLTINARFSDKLSITFVTAGEDGETQKYAQYFRSPGDAVGSLPEEPFESGMKFEGWRDQSTGEAVTAETVADRNITAEAVFSGLGVYSITAEYYYINDSGKEIVFNTDLLQAEGSELPYTLTAPATIQTEAGQVKGAPVYYPETPEVTLKLSDFKDNAASVRIKYVKYTATYDFVYLLKDLDGEGYTEIDRTSGVQGVLNSYVTPAVKAYDYYTLEEAAGAQITKASGQELEVRYARKNVQLTFETGGGSYVRSISAPYGSTVQLPADDPEREGYTFDGWYTDEALTKKAGRSVTLKGNTVLYAKWKGAAVNYTVVYMFEKYDDTGRSASYVYDNSKNAQAEVGSTVKASSAASVAKTGWEPDTAKNAASSVVVAADGSSVLQVYYKLKEYTFYFNAGTYSNYNITATLTGRNVSGTGNLSYTMKVKLGQDISAAWPGNATGQYTAKSGGWWSSSSKTYSVYFNGWKPSGINTRYVTKRTSVTPEMLPSSGSSITYTAQWSNDASEYAVHYWLQNADDDGYTDSEVYSQTYTSSSGNLSAKEISGYTYDHGNSGATNTKTYNFYYNRNTYRIDYYYGSEPLKTVDKVKFDSNISGGDFSWTPSAAECGVDDDYTFAGWYSNSSCQGEPYVFGEMPASNLVLYAKWAAPVFTVNFVDGSDTASSLVDAQTVDKYKKAEKPANPAKAGYTFDGWYTAAEGGDLFDWNTQITRDTTVYAHWTKKNISYIVRYLDEEGEAVSSDKEVSNPSLEAGQEITETAIAVAGYRPREVSKTLVLAEEDNLITFVYTTKAETTAYTVRYIINSSETGGDLPVAAEKTVADVPGNTSSVVELAAAVDYNMLYAAHPKLKGITFHPDSASKTLVLTSDAEQNVLTFYYSGYMHADVKLHFVDVEGNKISGDDVRRLREGESFTLSRTPIEGWELYKAVEGSSLDGPAAASEYRITDKITGSGLEFTLIYRKKATITALSASRQYDGEVLTLPDAQVRVEGLLAGHSLSSVDFDYENADEKNGRREAGTATVTPKDAVIEGPSADNYYTIRYISGTLDVTKINVTIRIEPDRWTGAPYNGELYKAGFTNPQKQESDYILISHAGYRDEYLTRIWDTVKSKAAYDEGAAGLKYYGVAEKNAGDYTYSIDMTLADLPQDANYSVGLYVRPGRLQIVPKKLAVTTESASKCYDGEALTETGAEIIGLTDADKDEVSISGTGSQTEVGSSENGYRIDWGNVSEDNYRIAGETLGTLSVTPGSIVITAPSASKTYDGKALTADGRGGSKVTASGLPAGFTLEAAASGSQTAAGSSANVVDDGFVIRNAKGEDKTALFTVAQKVDGILTVNKAPVTVSTGSGSKPYDGKALTAAEAGIEGLAAGETATVTATGSQTETGSSVNTYKIDWGTADKNNYSITANLGTLTVTDSDAEVVLTAPSDSKIYDGKPLTADGSGEKKVTASGLPEGFTVEATASGSRTDAGTSANKVDDGYVIRNAAGEDRTSSFKNIATVDGTLTVNKAPLKVTTGSASKAYDGAALTDAGASITGLAAGETAEVTANGSQTEVGSSSNTCSIKWGTAKADNYDLTKNLGTLTVTENGAAVTLTAASGIKTYDGTALTKPAVSASGLPDGFTVEASAGGSRTDAGTSTNVVNDLVVIRNAAGEDRTANFTNIVKTDGTLTVTKAALTVTTGSASKEYDGEALTSGEAEITGFANGETAEIEATGSQTDAGSSDNTYSIKWGSAKQGNYTIEEKLGTLTVTENTSEITLTAASADKTYDGTALSEPAVTAEGLPEGFSVIASASGSRIDAGESDNTVDDGYVIKNASGEDKTVNFTNVVKKNGTLTVTPKAAVITTGSASKEYDGTALTCTAASIDGLVDGETAEIAASGSITEVGSAENTYDLTWGSAKAANYTIEENKGTLSVTANSAEVTLTAPSDSRIYDGTALTADGTGDKKVVAGGLPEGFSVEATASGSQTDAGTGANAVDDGFVIRNAAGEDKTANFTNVKKVDGSLTVVPKAVTISTGSASKAYDGTELTNPEALIDGLADGESVTLTATGSVKETGTASNTYDISWDNAKAGNYTINENLGTLTITDSDADVVLTAESANKTYDGTELTAAGVAASGLPDGFTVEATAAGSQTDAGTSANVVADGYVIKDASGADKTANFTNVQRVDGTLTVNPKQVTITTGSADKAYDGEALTNAEAAVDGLADDESVTIAATGSVTEVGSAANTYEISWDNAKESNYSVSENLGELIVTANGAEVVLTAASDSKEYDGQALRNEGVASSGLPAGFTADASASGSQKDAGQSANSVNKGFAIKNAAGEDKTANFTNVRTVDGTLTVTPRKLTVTTGSADKEYDGTALTSAEAEIEGLADGDRASVKATGSQTELGSSDNTYEISWGIFGLFTKPENYTIEEKLGKLNVSENRTEVTLTAASDSKTYDGKELVNAGVSASGLPNGFTVAASASGSQTDAGTGSNTVNEGYKIYNADGADRTQNFANVKTADGTLTVSKRSVSLSSASDEKVYDGIALVNGEITVGGDGFADGEGASFTVSGVQKEAGSSRNSFTYDLDEGTKAANYDITADEGELTVRPVDDKVTVNITEHSGKEKYDGRVKTVSGYDVSIDNGLYTKADFEFSGSDRVSGTDAGSYPMELSPEDFTNKSPNFTNAEFIISDGTLEIEKRGVVLTSAAASKAYDGSVLTERTVSVTGDGFAEGEGASYDVTGAQKVVGASSNSFTYTLNDGTNEANYDIRTVFGALTIFGRADDAKYEVSVRAESGSAKYDGKAHSAAGLVGSAEDGSVVVEAGGHSYTVSGLEASAEAVDAGTYPVNIVGTPVVKDEDGNDVTDQFIVNLVSGSLEIEKRNVTLTSGSASRAYDGTALRNDKVEVSGDGFAEGEGAAYTLTGSQTLAGMSDNSFSYALNENTKAGNYEISTVNGQLTVTNRSAKYGITLRPASLEDMYDGTAKTVSGFESLSFTVEGNTYTVSGVEAGLTEKNAGTYAVNVRGIPVVSDSDGNDVTDQFEVTAIPGTLTITQRTVTMTSASVSQQYNGKPLTNSEVTVTGDGFAEGEGAVYKVTGSRLLPGFAANDFTYVLAEGTDAGNYIIRTVPGTLTVTNRDAKYEVTVKAASGEFLYDGEEHAASGFAGSAKAAGDANAKAKSVSDEATEESAMIRSSSAIPVSTGGNSYTIEGLTAGATATNAGEYMTTVTGNPVVRDASGNDVSDQFAVTALTGKLVIKPRQITMTSGSATHAYNGKELKNSEVTVGGDGFAEGEGASYAVTGGRTIVGVSDNLFDYELDNGTIAGNYIISKIYGKLNVTNRDAKYVLTMTPNSGSAVYDGDEHGVSGFVSTTAVIDGESYEVSGLTAGATGTDAGTYDVSVRGIPVVTDAAGNDVTSQFSVVSDEATFTITPRSVLLRSADESREYDGKPLTGSGEVAVEGDGFVGDDGVIVTPTASRTLVGATPNSFDWTFAEGTKADNYNVEVAYGLLSIVNREALYEIEMVANSDTVEYDGEEHSVSGFQTNEFEVEDSVYSVSSVEAGAAGIDPGVYTTEVFGAAVVNDSEGSDVSEQFAVTYKSGTLTITEKPSEDEEPGNNTDNEPGSRPGGPDSRTGDNQQPGGTNGQTAEGGTGGSGEDLTNIPDTVPAAAAPSGYWALLNLIMMIVTVLAGIYMIIRRVRNDDDDPDDDGSYRTAGSISASMSGMEAGSGSSSADSYRVSGTGSGPDPADADSAEDQRKNKRVLSVIASVLLAIVAVVAFFLTEDMTNTMAFVDRYTILMAVILILSVISILTGKKKTDESDESDESGAFGN